jgi:DnaJ-class molecular chaperone
MTSTEALQALELDGEITPAAIKRQYRKLSLQHHPDRFRGAAEKKKAHGDFLRIKDAYEFLKNNPPGPASEKRRAPEPRGAEEGFDNLREWKRQFDKEQKEEERRERERDEEKLREKGGAGRRRQWRSILKVLIFLGVVVLVGAWLEPSQGWKFLMSWFLIALFMVSLGFGG